MVVHVKITNDEGPFVAGEHATSLLHALLQAKIKPEPDGMWLFDLRLQPPQAAPLFRALMRVEAELLVQDADSISDAHLEPPRTDDQRRVDAFVALAMRIRDAARRGLGS